VASINEIILRSTNPFDRNNKATSFWSEKQESELAIDSIHAEVIAEAAEMLTQLQQNRSVKTLMVMGDAGSGKTYLLGRLKTSLNADAYFAYIQPFPKSDHIWRHILRETVNSLVQIPEGQQDSQLLLWLKNLSVFKKPSLKDKLTKVPIWDLLKSDQQKGRQDFIKKLSNLFKQASIFNAEEFFGVLFDLTDPDLESIACNWLKGDSISEESLKELRVKASIEDEDTAQNILANFGKISAETQPIVICFDQLESIDKLPNGSIDLPSLFRVNTLIHSSFKNFLVIISIVTDKWLSYGSGVIVPSDRDRIDRIIELNPIDLDQAEAICMTRLHHLHHQSIPIPSSSIYPLTKQYLEADFPMREANPRNVLASGRNIFQEYKKWLIAGGVGDFSRTHPEPEKLTDTQAHFKLIWIEELHKVSANITQINQISMLVLIEMLQTSIGTLQVETKSSFLPSPKFTSYSFSCKSTDKSDRIGVVWTEHEDMTAFYHIMNACQKAIAYGIPLYLIRFATVGRPNTKGNKIYNQIFTGDRHHHIKPDLDSIHDLATYYNLVKEVREGDLTVGGKTLRLSELEDLIRQSEILDRCVLLQKLKVIGGIESNEDSRTEIDPEIYPNPTPPIKPSIKLSIKSHTQIPEFILNLVKTQQLIGLELLISNTLKQFSQADRSQVEQSIEQLCQDHQIQILNPQSPIEAQLICLVASNAA